MMEGDYYVATDADHQKQTNKMLENMPMIPIEKIGIN